MAYVNNNNIRIVTPSDMSGFIPNGWSGLSNELEYYKKVPELNAAINIFASAVSSGKLQVFDGENEVETILNKPNFLQSQKQFIKQIAIHSRLYGNWFLFTRILEGFLLKEANIKSIWNIPKSEISTKGEKMKLVYYATAMTDLIGKYIITNNGKTEEISPDLINHFRDIDTTLTTISDLTSNERFDSLIEPLKNIIAAYEGRGNLITSRGAVGALMKKTSQEDELQNVPMTDPEKENLLSRWKKRFGLTKGKDPVIILEGDWDFKRFILNASELGLHEECQRDLETICNVMEIPIDLFAREKASTFANKEYALKQMYQNNVIPFAQNVAEVLQKQIFNNTKTVKFDFSELPIMQPDFKLNAETQAKVIDNYSKLLAQGSITEQEFNQKLLENGIL